MPVLALGWVAVLAGLSLTIRGAIITIKALDCCHGGHHEAGDE